jgi:hypothetical protein
MTYMRGVEATRHLGVTYASPAAPYYEMRRCLDTGYRADGFRRITTAAQVIELMDQIDAIAATAGRSQLSAALREKEISFYREHESGDSAGSDAMPDYDLCDPVPAWDECSPCREAEDRLVERAS